MMRRGRSLQTLGQDLPCMTALGVLLVIYTWGGVVKYSGYLGNKPRLPLAPSELFDLSRQTELKVLLLKICILRTGFIVYWRQAKELPIVHGSATPHGIA